MDSGTAPDPPEGLGESGHRLWAAIHRDFRLDEHEVALLGEAARVMDAIASLMSVVDREGLMQETPMGPKVHPAAVEARQQRLLLGRLISALRLPDTNNEKPQRRGLRGYYSTSRR